jgi:hypothetical protein
VAPQHVIITTDKREAQRNIVVTIEHVHHSLIDTPSVVRVISNDKQQDFYQKHLVKDTIKFYYLHNEQFEGQEYEQQLLESEAMGRVVMQLKAMIGYYPDESQLQQIIHQNHLHVFGFGPKENVPIFEGSGKVSTAVQRQTTINDS